MFYQLHNIGSSLYLQKEENENFSYPPHLHNCFELVIITDGEMEIKINNESFLLHKNDAVLIFPNHLHSLSSKKSKHLLFIFSPKIVQAFTVKYSDTLPLNPKFTLNRDMISRLRHLEPIDSSIEIKGLLYSVCAEFEKNTEFKNFSQGNNSLLMQIFSYVDKNFKTECSLSDVAKATGYDHSYISRIFKRLTNMSYNNYVNICRLNHASYLLKNTDISILECSIESGYQSLRTFNRNFKDYFSITPLEYKKANT